MGSILPPSSSLLITSPAPSSRAPWIAVADEVARSTGRVAEVIIDHDQDPDPLLAALVDRFPRLGIVALAAVDPDGRADTWRSVARAAAEHPGDGASDCLVIHVDTSIVYSVADALADEADEVEGVTPDGEVLSVPTLIPGPIVPGHYRTNRWDPFGFHAQSVGALLWPMMRDLRQVAEETGLRIVVISTDSRPAHSTGTWREAHRYRDTRVRSHIGDAGRYWSHVRIHVDVDGTVVTWKDELEGRTGRYVSRGQPRIQVGRRWRRKTRPSTTTTPSEEVLDLDTFLDGLEPEGDEQHPGPAGSLHQPEPRPGA